MNRNELYHVFNRGNNKERIFFTDRNYKHFLKLFEKYLKDYAKLYAYCLMPNHFHFLIRIKNLPLIEEDELTKRISQQFRFLFMSYSKGINKERGRTGSLFQKNFKRKLVDNESYFTSLIAYIHLNPVKAGLAFKFPNWEYSSYNALLSLNETQLARHEVLDWFGGRAGFIRFHEECLDLDLSRI
jgi:REP element-mobilizing transposase RayT